MKQTSPTKGTLRDRRDRARTANDDVRDYAVLAGFAPTCNIMTEDGPVPLEWIGRGDLVLTKDAGYRPILRVERTDLSMGTLKHLPELAPVTLEAGLLDRGLPLRNITMSPSQLVFIDRAPDPNAKTGCLVPADAIAPQIDPKPRPKAERVCYVSILLDGHHLIQIDGIWMGSLFIADLATEMPADDPITQQLTEVEMAVSAPILSREDACAFLASRRAGDLRKSA